MYTYWNFLPKSMCTYSVFLSPAILLHPPTKIPVLNDPLSIFSNCKHAVIQVEQNNTACWKKDTHVYSSSQMSFWKVGHSMLCSRESGNIFCSTHFVSRNIVFWRIKKRVGLILADFRKQHKLNENEHQLAACSVTKKVLYKWFIWS